MARKKQAGKRPPANQDAFAAFLADWRSWLAGALVGGVLAWLAYQIAPPPFRATATMVVDHNLEEAWVYFPDRQLFQFLQRETEKLEELAWSDAVMQQVASASSLEVGELRNGALQLSHPSDGGWQFHAFDRDPGSAAGLSSRWATAFIDAARDAVSASPELERARIELQQAMNQPSIDEAHLAELLEKVSFLGEHTKGVSPFLELALSQSVDLPTERSVSKATYLLVGSAIGAIALPAYLLFKRDL